MNTTSHDSRLHANLGQSLLAFLLIAASIPVPAGSEELGRLFFTPERRQMLDRQRQFNIQERKEIPEDPTLTINGVVTRSSGKRTVWMNGLAQDENDAPIGITVMPNKKDPGKIVIQANEAPAANARVGDTVNRTTGEAAGLLNGGRINIHPSPSR